MKKMTLDASSDYLKGKAKIKSFYSCPKCRTKETTYYEMQIRSSDEPATKFLTCQICDFKWTNNE